MKIRIGIHDITVRGMTAVERDVGGVLGFWSPRTAEIGIDPGIPPAMQASVLIHELLHACFTVAQREHSGDFTEEDACLRLDGPLTDALTHNPCLWDALKRAKEGKPMVRRQTGPGN